MAHLFVGNSPKVNADILESFAALDDSFWVFAEFNVGGHRPRQVDWLILRAVPDERPIGLYTTLIVGELKETTASYTGLENNLWTQQRNGAQTPVVMSNTLDLNPLQQVINTGNAVKDWLWNHERLFIDPARPALEMNAFNVWPTLVILSPPDVQHRLPHRLPYGAIWYDIEDWVRAIKSWVPRRGLQLVHAELEQLASLISESSGITRWQPTTPPVAEATGPFAVEPLATPPTDPPPPPAIPFEEESPDLLHGDGVDEVVEDDEPDQGPVDPAALGLGWLHEMAAWVARTEQRLARLEQAMTPRQPAAPRTMTRPDPAFTPDERRLLEEALRAIRSRGGRSDFPNVFAEMHRMVGGDSLSRRNFLGWGSGRAMMDQAVTEGWLAYGPLDRNNLPTLYLIDGAR